MLLSEQLKQRKAVLGRKLVELGQMTGMPASHISTILNGRKDAQASSLEALANAMDAKWMLIPRHLLPEVERLLAGKTVGPDKVPSTVDRLFSGDGHE